MNDTMVLYNGADMTNNVVSNDSIGDYLYKDFTFVTELPHGEFEGPQLREVTYIASGWNFMVVFFVMVLLVVNKFLAPQRFASMIAMSFQNVGSDKIVRDGQSFFNMMSLSVVASFVMLVSIFIQRNYIVYGANEILYDNINFFFDVAVVVTALLIFSYLLTLFYGWLFKTDALIYIYANLRVSGMAICAVLLIPAVMVFLFYPYKLFSVVCFVLLAILYLLRFAKLLIEIRMLSKLNFVNIFLYLCTIEILPILVILKMVIMSL